MASRHWYRLRSGELVILIAVGIVVLVFATGNYRTLLEKLYSPYAAFVAVIMLLEYVVLKGADRSALFRRQLHAAREKRRDDLLTMREMEGRLAQMETNLGGLEDERGEGSAQAIRMEVDALRSLLRSRI